MYTGIHIYTHGDLPVGVLAAMAKYAVAAMGCGLGADDIEDDLLGNWPELLADVAVVPNNSGATLTVVVLPHAMEAPR